MRYIPKRPSIETEGLEKHLNRTAEDHDGKGYDRFVEMVKSELNYTKAQMAIEFQVNRDTIYKWLNIYEKEGIKK